MRRRGNSRLRLLLSRRSLPFPPPEFGPRFRTYVNRPLTFQVILAIGIIIALASGVSLVVSALTGPTSQGTPAGNRRSNAPPPDTPTITLEYPDWSGSSNRLPLAEYVTHEGETIAGIAAGTGRSIETLLWANTIAEPDKPLPSGVHVTIPPVDGLLYLVKQGDTLERIAAAVEAKPSDITGYAPNHVAQDSDLHPGQQLLVPGATVQHRERSVTYDVRPGDTVGIIAGRFGLQPSAILAANEVSDPNLIYEGQALIIPPSSSVVAHVQPGDSLSSLAERWGVVPAAIANYPGNDISDPDTLIAGQALIIPIQPTASAPAAEPAAAGTTTPDHPSPAAGSTDGSTAGASSSHDHQADKPAPSATPSPEPAQAAGDATPSPHPDLRQPSPSAPQPYPTSPSNVSPSRNSSAAHPRGNFIWPAKGTISQHFGPTTVTIEPSYDGHPHFHNGIDIANKQGTPVVAADDGIVTYAGWSTNGLGYSVKIDHDNGFVTWYGHLAQSPSVSTGEQVGKGQLLGPMGSTGNSAGPHVHFMIVLNGSYQNPIDFLP